MNKKTPTNPRGAGRKAAPESEKKFDLNVRIRNKFYPLLLSGAKHSDKGSMNQYAAEIIEKHFEEMEADHDNSRTKNQN